MDGNLAASDRQTHMSEDEMGELGDSLMEKNLIKEAGEIGMDGFFADGGLFEKEFTEHKDGPYNKIISYEWNPLTNANHTKMLKDKAVAKYKLEVYFEQSDEYGFDCQIHKHGGLYLLRKADDIENELRTTTEAIVEAVKKMKK